MVRAGPMRHRVTIEALTDTQDDRGGLTEAWTTFAIRWARIVPLVGRERQTAALIDAEVDHRFELRYLDGVRPKMRVTFNGRAFDIRSVMHIDERQREVHLYAVENV